MFFLQKWYHIQKILFLINILFPSSKEEVINNPIKISDHSYPIILQTDTQYYILTSGEKIFVEKETGEIKSNSSFISFSFPYVLCQTQSNIYYFFTKNLNNYNYYLITINGYEDATLTSNIFPTSNIYLGYIKETKYEYEVSSLVAGRRCDISENEIIIYGKKNQNILILSYIIMAKNYPITIVCNFDDKLICKMHINAEYICALSCNGKIYFYVFILKAKLPSILSDCSIESYDYNIPIFSSHSDILLIDTSVTTNKVLCAKNNNNMNIECIIIYYTITEAFLIKIIHSVNVEYSSNYILSIPFESSNDGDCYFKILASELLLCCGGINLYKYIFHCHSTIFEKLFFG